MELQIVNSLGKVLGRTDLDGSQWILSNGDLKLFMELNVPITASGHPRFVSMVHDGESLDHANLSIPLAWVETGQVVRFAAGDFNLELAAILRKAGR